MPAAAGLNMHLGTRPCTKAAASRRARWPAARQAALHPKGRTLCAGSREPYNTSSMPYFLKSKAEALRKEAQDYVKTLSKQAGSVANIITAPAEEDTRDMILIGVSFVALVWLSMELVRLYLYWYEAAGFKTIAQVLHGM